MGTRSLTYVYEEFDGKEESILCLYRQTDGYPDGHGQELAEFLNTKTLVNGLFGDTSKVANGMGCLAAQLVSHFKTEAGLFYLKSTVQPLDAWQDYEYHVYEDKVIVKAPTEVIFTGSWASFEQFCNSPE